MSIINELCEWIPNKFDIKAFHFPYHVEKGGIYLKDAATMAGLGCIGRNNMLVTPGVWSTGEASGHGSGYSGPIHPGPQDLTPAASVTISAGTPVPKKHLTKQCILPKSMVKTVLPARDGTYARPICNQQMEKNIALAKEKTDKAFDKPVKIIKYCRMCEQSCPVGK